MLRNQPEQIRDRIEEFIYACCDDLDVPFETQRRIEKYVINRTLGQGVIEGYIEDPAVSEIVVQRYDNIVIEKGGKIFKTPVTFTDEEELQTIIKRIVQKAGRQINLMTPVVDARLADGSRVNATIPPVSPDGATLTIRKFNQKKLSGEDYLNFGSLNEDMLYFLQKCVEGKITMFVSGGTGTGKTTLLNMLSSYIPKDELIITIEDTCELKLQQPNVRRMEVRPTTTSSMMVIDQKALVKAALRQRPDRIILGETRDGSVVDLISAMSTGHEGSMSTIHANSPKIMCNVRIPILYSMNEEAHFSETSVAMQIAEAIQIIVQISRFPDGSRKISQISHVDGLDEDGKVKVTDIFRYDKASGKFKATGYVPEKLIEIMEDKGLTINTDIFRKEEEYVG